MEVQRKKRAVYEIIIVAVVVVVALLIGSGLYAGRQNIQKSGILVQELSMMRSSIALYKMLNKNNPATLEELTTATYDSDGTKKTFLEKLPETKSEKVVDPFGNAYAYDPKSGWVKSTSPDYEKW